MSIPSIGAHYPGGPCVTSPAVRPVGVHFTAVAVAAAWRRLLLAGLGTLGAGVSAAEPASVTVVQQAAAAWVQARVETTRIETEWTTQRQLLESTVNGLAERAQTLETKRDYLKAKTASEREELGTLEAMDKAAMASLREVEERAKALSTRLLHLRRSLPPRLSAALEMSYRSLGAPTLGVGERMQFNLTILNRCAQFNRIITCDEEVLDLGRGTKPQLLEVLYWGLSQGYALDRTAGKTWLGAPGPEGWQWEPLPEAAQSVADLMAIHRDKAEPDFVTVPAQVRHATTGNPPKPPGQP